jgi:hypothetical protein
MLKEITLEELYKGIGYIGNVPNIDEILNSEPKKEWLKTHEQIKDYKYLPVKKVEFLLHRLFKSVHFEIRHLIKDNDCSVSVRVHYEDRDGKLMFQDGIASCQISKTQPAEMAMPKAKSIAIMNAARSMGRIFGRDLNRDDETLSIVTTPKTIDEESAKILNAVTIKVKGINDLDALEELFKEIEPSIPKGLEKNVKAIFVKQRTELNG